MAFSESKNTNNSFVCVERENAQEIPQGRETCLGEGVGERSQRQESPETGGGSGRSGTERVRCLSEIHNMVSNFFIFHPHPRLAGRWRRTAAPRTSGGWRGPSRSWSDTAHALKKNPRSAWREEAAAIATEAKEKAIAAAREAVEEDRSAWNLRRLAEDLADLGRNRSGVS